MKNIEQILFEYIGYKTYLNTITYVGNGMCYTCDKIRRGSFSFEFLISYRFYIG